MCKPVLLSVLILLAVLNTKAQQPNIDSLKNLLPNTGNDTLQLVLIGKISNAYSEINPDSALFYGSKMLVLAKKHFFRLEEVAALSEIGYAHLNMGNFPKSLQILLSAIAIAQETKTEANLLPAHFEPTDEFMDRHLPADLQRLTMLSRVYQYTGILYINSGNNEKAIGFFDDAIHLAFKVNNSRLLSIAYGSRGRAYISNKQQDSALASLQHAYDFAVKADFHKYIGSVLLNLGRVYQILGKRDSANYYIRRALAESEDHEYTRGVVASSLLIADMFKDSGQKDSSLIYIQRGLTAAHKLNSPDLYLRSYKALAEYYRIAGINDSTVKYQALIIKHMESQINSRQIQQFQNIDFDAQQKQLEMEAARKDYQNRLRIYSLLGGMSTFLLVAILLLRVNRQRKNSNAILQQQKSALELAMSNLKSTQAQLIQAEKMASLGELTAGVAHEIQNPLNFVNNFSDLNQELISELTSEIDQGNTHEAKVIAENIRDNEAKINLHGRRADAIVKGMLHHSQSGTGQMELVNINTMADEYLRMTFHGLKLKDKSFNATIKTNFDPTIGNINAIPQDISRVLLNVYNNAFYAVNERRKRQEAGYDPTVSVSTIRKGDNIELRVTDNGMGIPGHVKDKIFQPFFTTKPSGQGTGLGLSLSYDVIKSHGGELSVVSDEGAGATFTITLPLT